MSGRNKSVGFAVLSIVLVLAAGLVVSGCGGSAAAPKPGKVYKVTFEASGGEPVPEAQLVEAGSKIELPKTMARTKFTFSGWYKDLDCKEPWDFAKDTVESDIILFANWKSAAGNSGGGGGRSPGGGVVTGGGTTRFTVTFDDNGGTLVGANSKSVANGASVGSGMPSATKTGKVFFGWNTDKYGAGTAFTSKTAITGNITVYAMWDPPTDRNGLSQPTAFLVSTPDALNLVGKPTLEYPAWTLDKYYELNDDINMYGVTFHPIGEMGNGFKGTFDGDGHIIENLTIIPGPLGHVGEGMFGVVDSGAVVTGVTLVNCNLDCTNPLVAGMVGWNYGTVKYCNVIDGTIAGNVNVGGVVGYNWGTVQNCYATGSTGSVTASEANAGGVVGQNNGGTVQNCFATVTVSATVGSAWAGGGVVGYNNGGTVQNCYATGSVIARIYVGGVVGWNDGTGTVQNCVALNPSVTATIVTTDFGRVVGYHTSGTLTNNYARRDLSPSGGGWSKDAGDDKVDGADFTIGTPLSGVFNSGNGWSSLVWNNIPASGNLVVGVSLPTLKDMPAGTQDPKLLALTP